SPRPPAPPVPDPKAGLGQLLASTASVEIVPELILRRADGRLSAAEEAVLEDLLSASPVARVLEERFAAAEEAYRTAPREPLPGALGDQIVRTMAESTGPIPVSTPPILEDHTVELDALDQPTAEAPAVEPSPAPRFAREAEEDEGSGFFPRRLRRRKKEEPAESGPTFTPFPEFTPADAPEPESEPGPIFEPAPEFEPAAELEPEPAFEPEAEPEPAFEPEPTFEPELQPVHDAEPAPSPTMEWEVPDESADEQLAAEAQAAHHDEPDATVEFDAATADEEPEHVQSASGAVDETVEFDATAEADVEEPADLTDPDDDAPDEQEPDAPAENEDEMAADPVDDTADEEAAPQTPALPTAPPPAAIKAPAPAPAHAHRPSFPGRTALLPALAVVVIAAFGAMVASGVFGGNDPSPPLDTGIVPERAQQAVPEGEAAAVVDDLRAASAEARRQRLADQRRDIAAGIAPAPDDEGVGGTDAPSGGE
ncbi:MAG TPA: hypothetical protein VN238_12525, partial [Solirubrobacteraceae bacterium]|nr:hypothetical protein [Solirubrobacteraceae bacterium]